MHYENAIHSRSILPFEKPDGEHDVSDSVTVPATTRGANLTLPRGSATLWRKTRYVMLLLNHSDRTTSPRVISAQQNIQPFLRQRTFARNDTQSEDVGSEFLVTHARAAYKYPTHLRNARYESKVLFRSFENCTN